MEDKLNRMRSLVNQLNQASDVYYNGKGEILTDYEWDALFDQLKKLEAVSYTHLTLPTKLEV